MKRHRPLGVGAGGGTAHLALKRQAHQIPPLQGEGGDKPLPYKRKPSFVRCSKQIQRPFLTSRSREILACVRLKESICDSCHCSIEFVSSWIQLYMTTRRAGCARIFRVYNC